MYASLNKIQQNIQILYRAVIDERTPWQVKATAFLIVAYFLSPIDLIPDFIPVLGLLDEVILIPLLVRCAIRMIPAPLLQDLQQDIHVEVSHNPNLKRAGLLLVCSLWFMILLLVAWSMS